MPRPGLVRPAGAPDVADTFKTTYLSSKDFQMTRPIDALKTIARYVEAKKPKTLAEAEHMLDLISVMADETIRLRACWVLVPPCDGR
jgi:hypothetical protein